ncbi:MAG: hypothetical protein JXA81_12620 [Sedimentisphaerales bacterium]|nr:hypothetical protein [Sedimentisphaerales bacterium]
MQSNEILNEYTELYKFVDSLRKNISRSRADHSYPTWSNQFLEFCEHTADATLNDIQKKQGVKFHFIDASIAQELVSFRLSSIMKGWKLLHAFIKPVLDANTLTVPNSLVHFLSEHIGSLKVVKDAKIVIELIPQFNYFQDPHTTVRKAMAFLKKATKSYYEVARIGFLGLPFSQSESLCLNCILYHEAAHFIAEEAKIFSDTMIRKLADELVTALNIDSGEDFFEQYKEWAGKKVGIWMEELFADIVAVRLLGPAYTLAYLKLLQLVYELNEKEIRIRTFEIDHPADALRIREQVKILEDDGWQDYLEQQQWNELKKIAAIKENDYLPPSNDQYMEEVWKTLMGFICSPAQIEKIHQLANEKLADREPPIDLYKESYEEIRECLEHGIVPSASRKKNHVPHPTSIINGAIIFLLSGMENLYKIVDKEKIDKYKPKDRALLEKRVEMWCMKAIEDWLMTRNKTKTQKSCQTQAS